ncbi:MAG: DUF2442 domain-containing protein [Candidatus Polarisedimenticolia bacterium]
MKKKSAKRGKSTSAAEVTNISRLGFWLLVDDEELFVSFRYFPWFRKATIGQVLNVELPNPGHLYWPDLDIDLAVESIAHPERFPLVSKGRPNYTLHPAAGVGSVPSVTRTRARRG